MISALNSPKKPEKRSGRAASAGDEKVEHWVHFYGDLIYDLCEFVLWSSSNAQLAFRAILKELRRASASETYQKHEREWVLRVACDRLRAFSKRNAREVTASEQIEINATQAIAARLKHFDTFFHRLQTDEQILLLLRDKYGLPYSEIASAMDLPEGSLKVARSQALRSLEEWLWNSKP